MKRPGTRFGRGDATRGIGEEALRTRYLDLLEGALLHTLYYPIDARDPPKEVKDAFRAAFIDKGITIDLPSTLVKRLEGRDRPIYAQTMIGQARLTNLRECVVSVIEDGVPGDLIETGCWRGGAGIMMKGILDSYGITDRAVWLADSFQGLPEPNPEKFPADEGDINFKQGDLAISLDVVRGNFERYGLLDERVRFVEGWFRDTLPGLRSEQWSLIRLDGDLYESTMDGLENLYPQLAVGGYLILDDFNFDNCRQAVEDYRRDNGITDPIETVDWTGAYWRRVQ